MAPRTVIERLLARRAIEGDCWVWQGSKTPRGYGIVQIGNRPRKTQYVHRLSYEAFVGAIPRGLDLDHLCRVRACFNPSHLEPVTRSVNTVRGIGPAMLGAINGTKTHCSRGHAFDETNTRQRPSGGRTCRQCERLMKTIRSAQNDRPKKED